MECRITEQSNKVPLGSIVAPRCVRLEGVVCLVLELTDLASRGEPAGYRFVFDVIANAICARLKTCKVVDLGHAEEFFIDRKG